MSPVDIANSEIKWVNKGVELDWDKMMAQLPPAGFHVFPRRWVIERTFAWLGQNRRLSDELQHFLTHPMNL